MNSQGNKNIPSDFRSIVTDCQNKGQTVLSENDRESLKRYFNHWLTQEFKTRFFWGVKFVSAGSTACCPIGLFSDLFLRLLQHQGLGAISLTKIIKTEEQLYEKSSNNDELPLSLVQDLESYFCCTVIPAFELHLKTLVEAEKAEARLKIKKACQDIQISTVYNLSTHHNIVVTQDEQKTFASQVMACIQKNYQRVVKVATVQDGNILRILAKSCLEEMNYPVFHDSYQETVRKLITIFETQNESEEVMTYHIKRLVKESFSQLFNSPLKKEVEKISNACKKGNITKIFAIRKLSPATVLDQEQLQDLQKVLIGKIESVSSNASVGNIEEKVVQYLTEIHYPHRGENNQTLLQEIFTLKKNLSNESLIYQMKEWVLEIISKWFNVDQSDKAQIRKNQREVLNEITQNLTLPLNKQPSS
jgi:septum formation topological specificity factor MinE